MRESLGGIHLEHPRDERTVDTDPQASRELQLEAACRQQVVEGVETWLRDPGFDARDRLLGDASGCRERSLGQPGAPSGVPQDPGSGPGMASGVAGDV